MQCDYLFIFQVERRINRSFLLRNCLKNASDAKDDEYETLILTYNKLLDSLVLASCISRSRKEEENSPPHTEDVVTNSE